MLTQYRHVTDTYIDRNMKIAYTVLAKCRAVKTEVQMQVAKSNEYYYPYQMYICKTNFTLYGFPFSALIRWLG